MAYRSSCGLQGWGLGDLVSSIAQAIAQMEGYNSPGTLAQRNNNPGNLRSGAGQIGTSGGFAVFPDAATGWAALDNQVQLNINRGLTLDQFFAGGNGYPGYAPSADANNPAQYASFVGSQVGISTTVPLSQLQAAGASAGSFSLSDMTGASAFDPAGLFDLSTVDFGGQTGGGLSPLLIGGVVLAGLGLLWLTG
jgi:hypothetical protein